MSRWRPLQPAVAVPRTLAQAEAMIADVQRMTREHGEEMSRDQIVAAMAEEAATPLWRNLDYQVAVVTHQTDMNRVDGAGKANMIHLSIKRVDKRPVRDWRDLQEIKNQLVGPECEAVEIFPAESRLTDTANQYHLWAIDDPGFRFPIGWHSGRMVDDKIDPATNVVQRKRRDPLP